MSNRHAKRRRGPGRALYIALADVMMCLAGRLILEYNMDKVKLEEQILQLEAKKTEVEQQIVDAEAKVVDVNQRAIDEQARLEKETAEKKAELDGRISDVESQLAQRQDDFQNWDLVVHRYNMGGEPGGFPRKADAHLYLRESGAYRDGKRGKMTNDELRAWLKEQGASSETRRDHRTVIAVWTENGANDQWLRLVSVMNESGVKDALLTTYIDDIILPSGVPANASQKGTEGIKPKKKEGDQ